MTDRIDRLREALGESYRIEGGAVLDVYRGPRLVCRISRYRWRLLLLDAARGPEVCEALRDAGISFGEYGGYDD